jgi:murein DD-endopeptidase MepM/ murein hydrolase activator NlpD
VVAAGSDEIYQHIIEVAHESGYKTRYLCHQSAEISVEEGSAVQAGDILLTITTDETQLDYQVIYEDAPIDPLSVIDARG